MLPPKGYWKCEHTFWGAVILGVYLLLKVSLSYTVCTLSGIPPSRINILLKTLWEIASSMLLDLVSSQNANDAERIKICKPIAVIYNLVWMCWVGLLVKPIHIFCWNSAKKVMKILCNHFTPISNRFWVSSSELQMQNLYACKVYQNILMLSGLEITTSLEFTTKGEWE